MSSRLPALTVTHPDVAAEWHPTKNGDLTAADASSGSNRKVWWHSPACGHEWLARIHNRARLDNGCPDCRTYTSEYPVNKHYRPFAATHPDLAATWHPTKNDEVTPHDITAGSSRKVWWKGEDCGHSWIANPGMRQRYGCAVCKGRQIEVGVTDLATTHPKVAERWHPTLNTDTPRDVTFGSKKVRWWVDAGSEPYQAAVSAEVKRRRTPKPVKAVTA